MITLEIIFPEELTNEDIRWIVDGCKGSYDDCTPLRQVEAAMAGYSGIFRISGDGIAGVVVLNYGPDFDHSRVATITCLAGKGLIRNFETVHKQILAAAAGVGARKVNGYATRPGLAALYQRRTKARLVPMFVEDVI